MHQKGDPSFQIKNNNFKNYSSDFVYHTTLKTTAHLTHPHFAKLSVTRNSTNIKILCIKTSQSLMQVLYKNNEFQEHTKVNIKESLLAKQIMTFFTFKTEIYSASNPPILIIGYKSGLISCYDTINESLLRLYNYDEKAKAPHKIRSVTLITVLPPPHDNEILVMFADSTSSRYYLNAKIQNDYFVEKIKKFDEKTSFNKATHRFKHDTKNKNNFYYCCRINDSKPELNFFYACAQGKQCENPKAFYKFNHRTITDFVVKKHSSFSKTFLRSESEQELTVLAFSSLDGYLALFELNQMEPLLSYKGTFGGINSFSFSENCELIAISGQDDCITVLDLNTFKTLRCEGHKSFISRCIFQTIPMIKRRTSFDLETEQEAQQTEQNSRSSLSIRKNSSEQEFVRIIGAGLDALLSFWEFPRRIFGTDAWIKLEEERLPISLKANHMPAPITMKPVHMEPVPDALGWIEMCDNMLIQCGYDGTVSTNLIRDLAPSKSGENKEDETDKSSTSKNEKILNESLTTVDRSENNIR